jgi:hypothetical protein
MSNIAANQVKLDLAAAVARCASRIHQSRRRTSRAYGLYPTKGKIRYQADNHVDQRIIDAVTRLLAIVGEAAGVRSNAAP